MFELLWFCLIPEFKLLLKEEECEWGYFVDLDEKEVKQIVRKTERLKDMRRRDAEMQNRPLRKSDSKRSLLFK